MRNSKIKIFLISILASMLFIQVGLKQAESTTSPLDLQMSLSSGWNFISFPKLPSASRAIETVLADISPNVRILWGYDNENKQWKKWKPLTSASTSIESGKGYWIYMNEASSIDMTGWNAATTNIYLFEGWNLIGFNGKDGSDTMAVLSEMPDKWEIIWNWENGSWKAKHQNPATNLLIPALTNLNKGKAYWLKIRSGEGSFDYNAIAHYTLLDGFYQVGVNILSGKWHSTGTGSSCYWARRDSNQKTLDNHAGLAGGTVTVLETDYEVEFNRCGTWDYVGQ